MSLDVTLKFTSIEVAEKYHEKLYALMPTIESDYTAGEYGGIYLTLRNLTSEDLLIIDQLVEHEHL